MVTQAPEATLGRELIQDGRLEEFRQQLDISYTALAHLIGVNPTALRKWIQGSKKPSTPSVSRIGDWYAKATEVLATKGWDLSDLTHISAASRKLTYSHMKIVSLCNEHNFDVFEMEPIGFFLHRDDFQVLAEQRRW